MDDYNDYYTEWINDEVIWGKNLSNWRITPRKDTEPAEDNLLCDEIPF